MSTRARPTGLTPWKAKSGTLRNGVPLVWIEDADGREIVHWSGFDSSAMPKSRRLALAKQIVRAVNGER